MACIADKRSISSTSGRRVDEATPFFSKAFTFPACNDRKENKKATQGCFEPYLGWQGIVPRRAEVMAKRSCDIMIGNLITIEEIVDRLKPDDFFESLHPVLQECHAKILQKIGEKYWPNLWRLVPGSVKEEIHKKALEESEQLYFWKFGFCLAAAKASCVKMVSGWMSCTSQDFESFTLAP